MSAPACASVVILPGMRRRASLILSVLMLLAGIGGVVGWRWWQSRPPYGPEALSVQATLERVDQATVDAALKPVRAEIAGDGDQIFLGRVSWARPPGTRKGNSFRIVVLDKRSHLMPGSMVVSSARPEHVGVGLDGSLDIAQKRYPWLEGVGARESNGSYWTSGSAIFVSSVDASPVTFQTVLHPARRDTRPERRVATAPAAVEDLLVALISVGPDGQVYWAKRLLN
jgi:hypothetical protein